LGNGHGGIDLLIGEHESTLTINSLPLTEGNLAGIRTAIGAIPTAGITVRNISGFTSTNKGNDLLIGGGNIDVLFGGPGNDFLYGGNFLNNGETEPIEETTTTSTAPGQRYHLQRRRQGAPRPRHRHRHPLERASI
jgi:hypothetical protein